MRLYCAIFGHRLRFPRDIFAPVPCGRCGKVVLRGWDGWSDPRVPKAGSQS